MWNLRWWNTGARRRMGKEENGHMEKKGKKGVRCCSKDTKFQPQATLPGTVLPQVIKINHKVLCS